MAKIKKSSIDDEFDFDSELDLGDFNFMGDEVKDDRKPITKVISSIPSGIKSGLKDTSFLKNLTKTLLPKGFGEAIDLYDNVDENIKNIYSKSVEEIKPVKDEFKRVIPKLIPSDSKKLPKKAAEILKRWEEETKSQSDDLSPSEMREAMMSQQMSEIFKFETEQNIKNRNEDVARDKLKQGIDLIRHRDNIGLGTRQTISLANIEKYLTNIDLSVKKKQLEIGYRQLFATQETLEHLRKDSVENYNRLDAIIKNTSLPDFVKLQDKDLAVNNKNKFSNQLKRSLFGDEKSFVERLSENINSKLSNSISEISNGIMQGLSAAEMAKDNSGMMGDPYVTAGETIGEMGIQSTVEFFTKKYKDDILNSRLSRKLGIKQKGTKLESLIENQSRYAKDFKRKDLSYDTGIWGFLGPLFQELIPDNSIDKTIDITNSKNILGPAQFTKRTDKSINEIIPGYLSRILREVQVLRTGNNNIDLIKYDFNSNRFTTPAKLGKDLYKQIVNKDYVNQSNNNLNEIISDIESKTNTKLDDKTKKLLKTTLFKNSNRGNSSEISNLLSFDNTGKISDDNLKNLENIYSNYYSKLTPEERLEFDRKHNYLSNSVNDSRELIQNNVDIGNLSELKKLGIVGKDNEINTDKILDYFLDEDEIGDVYLPNNSNPILTKIKLKSKQYFDKESGKVIEKLSDIKGSVVDKVGKIVLTEDEIPRAFMLDTKNKKVKKLTSIVKNFKSKYKRNFKKIDKIIDVNKKKISKYINSKIDSIDKYLDTETTIEEDLDLFVDNELKPRIKNNKLKMGKYRDKTTGEVIKHYNEIKDTIIDEKGNVVLDKEELSKLRILDPITKVFKKIRNFNYSQYSKQVNDFKDKTINPNINKFSDKFKNFVDGLSDKINDVYVKGEEKPRILAVKLKQGKYKHKATGQVLDDIRKIDGDIVDENNITVVTSDEVPRLVVFEPNIKQFKAVKLLAGFAKWAWNYQTKTAPAMVAFNFRMIGKGLSLAKDSIMVGIRGFVKDVYVGDEKEPRMYAERIKNGYYYLRTSGKVITHQNQIIDEVVDKFGNVVINFEELENLRVYTSIFKWLNPYSLAKAAGKMIFKGLWGATKLGLKASKFIVKSAFDISTKVLDKTINFLTKPVDVYISSKSKPVLYAKDLKDGKYFSAKTGTRLFHHREIDGAVLNEAGETVLTEEEAQTGLYDITGRKIRPGLLKIGMLGLKKLNKLFSIRTKLNNGKFALSDKVLKDSGLTKGEQINAKSLDGITSIYKLLSKTLNKRKMFGDTDGDGIRENSYQDLMRKRTKKEKNTIQPTVNKNKEEDKDKGFFGKLLSILGGVGAGLVSKFSGFLNLFNTGALGIIGSFAKTGFSMVGSLISMVAKMMPSLDAKGLLKGLSNAGKGLLKVGRLAALPALAAGAAGYAIDAGLGKLGVGKDEDGNDLKLDENQDDLNWDKMSFGEKLQSGAARGLEKGASFLFLDNLARQAAKSRIENETKYLKDRPTPDEYDSEGKPKSVGAGSSSMRRPVGNLKLANGPLYDGRKAHSFLNVGKNVSLKNMNPELLKAFYGMVEEYGVLTGKKVTVHDGFRSYEEQLALYKKYGPGRAAPPGKSLHEFGLAFDADSKTLDEMDNLGLMRKYGFTRPVGTEPWHVEPIGIQKNLTYFKKNTEDAIEAIKSGYYKGGGGLGVIPNAPKYGRDSLHSQAIMTANGSVVDNSKTAENTIKPDPLKPIPNTVNISNVKSNPNIQQASYNTGNTNSNIPSSNLDNEPKLSSYNKNSTGISKDYSVNMPKDPSVKIPDGDIPSIITAAAKTVGIDPDIMLKTAAVESGFNPNAKAKGSSATGLFQFVDSTWEETVKKYGNSYGYSLSTASPYDPKANSLMAAHYIKNNISNLKTPSGVVNATDAYMTLFLGKDGANTFLKTLSSNPNEFGSRILPDAAKSNPDIFFSGGRARTVSEIYTLLQNRVNNKAKSFGINTDKVGSTINVSNSNISNNNSNSGGYMNTVQQTKTPLENIANKPSAINTLSESVNNNPFNRVYGAQPNINNKPSVNENIIPKDLMVNTETILNSQLNIQTKMLKELVDIKNIVKGKSTDKVDNKPDAKTETSNNDKNTIKEFTMPEPKVRMSRSV